MKTPYERFQEAARIHSIGLEEFLELEFPNLGRTYIDELVKQNCEVFTKEGFQGTQWLALVFEYSYYEAIEQSKADDQLLKIAPIENPPVELIQF